MVDQAQQNLREALKRVAVALKETGVPFALMGGYAVWARGGPEPDHDVDFMVADADAEKTAELLAEKGVPSRAPTRGLAVQGVRRGLDGRRDLP